MPSFGTPTPTADGYTVQISNYDTTCKWSASSTVGSALVSSDGLVTVSSVGPGTLSTVTVTASKSGYANGVASTSGTSSNGAARAPSFGTPVRTDNGFTVNVTNYDDAWSWAPSVTSGTVSMGTVSGTTLPLTITGLDVNESATVTMSTTRSGYDSGSAQVVGSSRFAALAPEFDTPVRTLDGFTVNVTNHDSSWNWTASVDSGTVTIGTAQGSTLTLTVSGLSIGRSATITVSTSRTDYMAGSAQVSDSSLLAAKLPTFSEPVRTVDGFTVNVTNYDSSWSWTASVDSGTVTTDAAQGRTLPLTVTGLSAAESATVTVNTARDGYRGGSASVAGTALFAPLTPTFESITATADGFTAQISNHDVNFSWTGVATAGGTVTVNGTGLVTVSGVAPGTSATATIGTTRIGYVSGSADVAATSITGAARTPTFGTPTRTADGFTVQITNYSASYSWAGAATANGSVQIDGNGLVTVSGLAPGTLSTVTASSERTGYATGSADVQGRALNGAARSATFDTPVRTADGFSVRITNFDAAWTWTPSVESGTVTLGTPANGALLLTVTEIDPDVEATLSVETSRTGYDSGTAQVSGRSLKAALTPAFSSTVRDRRAFSFIITNFDTAYSWNIAASIGTVETATVSTGVRVRITGLADGQASTVTITTTRTEYADGAKAVVGSALDAPRNVDSPVPDAKQPSTPTSDPSTPGGPSTGIQVPPGVSIAPGAAGAEIPLTAQQVVALAPLTTIQAPAASTVRVIEADVPQRVATGPNSLFTGLQVLAPTWSVQVSAREQDGTPRALDPNGRLSVEQGRILVTGGTGYAPNSPVRVYVMSTPTLLGTVMTDAQGRFDAKLPLPESVAVGTHTAQVVGLSPAAQPRAVSVGIDVTSMRVRSIVRQVTFAAGSKALSKQARLALSKAVASVPKGVTVWSVAVGTVSTAKATAAQLRLAKTRAMLVRQAIGAWGVKVPVTVRTAKVTGPAYKTNKVNVVIAYQAKN